LIPVGSVGSVVWAINTASSKPVAFSNTLLTAHNYNTAGDILIEYDEKRINESAFKNYLKLI